MASDRFGAKIRYGVFPVGETWKLCCETLVLARFDTQHAAIAAGKRAACEAMGSGFDAELHYLSIGGELQQADPASFGH
jgi:hypothetical protein